METSYEIKYHREVVKHDLPALGREDQLRVMAAIEQKLMTRPEWFGVPLRSPLAGYRKLRIGDLRLVFKIKGKTVFVLVIKQRSTVYHVASSRF